MGHVAYMDGIVSHLRMSHVAHAQSERIRKIEEEVVVVADRIISVSGVLCDEVKLQFQISEDKLRMVL